MGGGDTTVKQQPADQQLPPQTREGTKAAADYFGGIISHPPVYTGQTLAPATGTQQQAITQGQQIFGQPTQTQTDANTQLQNTLTGGYIQGPQAQEAVRSLAQPIFQQYRTEVMPSLRDAAQATGQGVTGTRRVIAQDEAQQKLAQNLATSAFAPIFTSERQNQMKAAALAPESLTSEIQRIGALSQTGATERMFAQEPLDAAMKQFFTDPVSQQRSAATSMLGGANFGPGGSSSKSQSQMSDAQMGMQAFSTAAAVAMMAMMIMAA